MQLKTEDRTIPVFTMFAININESKSVSLQAEKFILKSDHYNYSGILVPDSNANYLNPWFFASLIIKNSDSLTPFIAVNSIYTHPFYTAKYIANLSLYLERPLHINYITGTALFDSSGLGDSSGHDSRYERLGEYYTIVNRLLEGSAPVSFHGSYYKLTNITLPEPLSYDLQPVNYIAGKSDASLKLIEQTGAQRLCMAMPLADYHQADPGCKTGFHFGIIAREDKKHAFEVLSDFAPVNNASRRIKEFTTRQSEAIWKKELAAQSKSVSAGDIYNLTPFINGYSDVPYLTGSIESVAAYIFGYLMNGLSSIVIEVPMTGHDEFNYINQVFLSVQTLIATSKQPVA